MITYSNDGDVGSICNDDGIDTVLVITHMPFLNCCSSMLAALHGIWLVQQEVRTTTSEFLKSHTKNFQLLCILAFLAQNISLLEHNRRFIIVLCICFVCCFRTPHCFFTTGREWLSCDNTQDVVDVISTKTTSSCSQQPTHKQGPS